MSDVQAARNTVLLDASDYVDTFIDWDKLPDAAIKENHWPAKRVHEKLCRDLDALIAAVREQTLCDQPCHYERTNFPVGTRCNPKWTPDQMCAPCAARAKRGAERSGVAC